MNMSFSAAKPVWAKSGANEMNSTLLFETSVKCGKDTVMNMTGHFDYRVYINGRFVFFGPARAGKGYFRVDRLPIGKYLTEKDKDKENKISVIVSGYFCDNYYIINDRAFFCAEFTDGDRVFGETGSDAWRAYIYEAKQKKVQRYSAQRTFTEVYDFINHRPLSAEKEVELAILPISSFIERRVSYPSLPFEEMGCFCNSGTAFYDENAAVKKKFNYGDSYREDELLTNSSFEYDRTVLTYSGNAPMGKKTSIAANCFVTAEMKCNLTGFIKLRVTPKNDAKLILAFDEILTEGKIDIYRLTCINAVIYYLKGGESYELITAEPYTLKYLNIISLGADIELESVGIIRLDFNESDIIRRINPKADEQIKRIYDAAIETFRQNTLDICMDCPSRERAGWLCDSFFTSRVERLLSRESKVERSFLENFFMEDVFANLPRGMLPMCYPANFPTGNFIPNWAMWYAIELKEYLARTGDMEFIDSLKEKMYSLLSYFRGFENSDGLLERLEKWVFIEWSRCNDLTQDINYPSNMLYSMFKSTLSELYGDEKLENEAQALRQKIREKSMIGIFFCDNSVYNDKGEAILSGEITETCQYYAFFTGVASRESDSELWETMINDFGPERRGKESGKWENIHFANAFIGNYLRLELLMKAGLKEKLEANIREYFDYMALRTGTLWENDSPSASCNHGFASHVLIWLDYLGYIDYIGVEGF